MAYPYFNNYGNYGMYQPQSGYFQNNGNSSQINSGFVRVQSEDEAKRYPVAAGGSVTFIDANAPFCYVKTAPISPMDAPLFKRYRLVEEPDAQAIKNSNFSNVSEKSIDTSDYVKRAEFDALCARYDDIKTITDKLRFDIDAVSEKSSKKMVQKARKDAEEE